MLESFTTDKFTYKKLSKEEQQKRGILGRLVGIIADTKEPTRNGRKYSIDLWKKVFDNDIIKEKIANRCLFGELAHPVDREETDPEKIAICLAEQPKVGNDGKLYGVFDILNTPNGKILKAMCDYGTIIGVSSRGSGDLYTDDDGNEAVDPDTYNCEAWDAVIIPAVESARLQYVTEALDTKRYNKTLKQRLTEELNAASDEDKEIMKEALNNLDINLKESIMYKGYGIDKDTYGQGEYSVQVNGDDMLFKTEEEAKKFIDELPEEDQINEVVNNAELDAIKDNFTPPVDKMDESMDDHRLRDDAEDDSYIIIDNDRSGHSINHVEGDTYTVEELINLLNRYDSDTKVLIGNDPDKDSFYTYSAINKYSVNEYEIIKNENESISESCGDKEVINESEEAGNAGNDLLVNELQESLLKNKQLVEDNLSLQEKLSVCNAKETKLGEELAKYKKALAQVSMKVKEVKSLKEELNSLNEALTRKDKVLQINRERLEKSIAGKKELNDKMSVLEESVNNLNSQNEELTKNVETLTEKLHTSNLVVQKCRRELKEARELYVQSRSESYGVKTKDVLSKLNESYSLNDVDSICESLSEYKRNMNKLPFRLDGTSKISIKESSHEYIRGNSNNDDDYVSDTLLNIANLK